MEMTAEEKQARAIERRRQMEKERKERIMNVKQRTMGVDLEAIDQQIREKKEREAADKARDEAFEREALAVARKVQEMEREHEAIRREMERERMQFISEEQKKEMTRDWDLNSPEYKKNLGEDPQKTVSGLTVMDGEDVGRKEREKQQREELRAWLESQKKTKEERDAAERELTRLHDMRALQITERTKELERLQAETRRAMAMEWAEENKSLAAGKAQRDKEDLISRTLQDLETLGTISKDPVLKEDPSLQISAVDPNRVIPQQFKGMTPTQRKAILEQQQQQAVAREEERRREEEQKRKWEQYEISVMRSALLREREIERQRKEIAKMVIEENLQNASEATVRKSKVTETFTNKVDPTFFDQFGTTSR